MAFTIPNEADAFHAAQASPDKVDIDALVAGLGGLGVVSGCAVTAQGTPDMTVAVASGSITGGGLIDPVTGGNVTITTANATNPRIDLVVTNGTTNSAIAGTPAANPVMPSYTPATEVLLAAVYVPANDTTIATNQITDKRVILPAPVSFDPVLETFGAPTTAFEFATSSLTGLTAIGTPTTENANTSVPGCLFYQDSTATVALMGRYLASPTPPFTAIVEVQGENFIVDYNYALLLIGVANPATGAFVGIAAAHAAGRLWAVDKWTSRTDTGTNVYASTVGRGPQGGPYYLAAVVNSTSDIDTYWSYDGYAWRKSMDAYDPAITVGSVGLGMAAINSGGAAVAFGYLRIWNSALTFPA